MKTSPRWLSLFCALGLAGGAMALPAAERAPLHARPATADIAAPARVIIKFKTGSSLLRARSLAAASSTDAGPQAAKALGQRLGLSLSDGRTMGPRSQLLSAGGISAAALAQRLAAEPDVEWAVPDQRRFALAAPNDPLYGTTTGTTPAAGQWYLRQPTTLFKSAIDVESAWSRATGSGVVVAVLDSGIRSTHPDLSGQLLGGYDFIADVPTANDGNGRDADPSDPGDWITTAEDASGDFAGCGAADSSWHGTQIAGLVAAATNNATGMAGIARDAKVLPVRVLGKCGGFDADIIDGMRWAAGLSVSGVPANTNPARVINLSLGSSGACSAAYRDAVAELTAAGVVVVAAAGNDGLAVGTPANCPGVIAVAGLRHVGTKVGYSDLGSNVALSAPAGNCVNSTGTCLYPLLSTTDSGTRSPVGPSYTTGGDDAAVGTSFAAPLVAGTVAVMLSANPSLTPAQVTSALKSSARAFPTTGGDAGATVCQAPTAVAQDSECYCTTSTCGAGMLDAGAAVAAAAGLAAPPTAAITASSSTLAAGSSVTLSAASSTAASGLSITAWLWEITSGGTLATLSGTDTATTTLTGSAAGNVVVRLTVTDSNGQQSSTTQTLTITAASSGGGGGGGGGALSPAWALAALAAAMLLSGPRRVRRRQRGDHRPELPR